MTIEQRLAEIIGAFRADALSSTVNLNVDLDVVLCVLAQALLAAFRTRLRHRHPRHPPAALPRHLRNHHHRWRHHHGHPQPTRLLTRPAPVRPARRHHRPLVAKPPPPLPVQLAGGTIRCMEIRANDLQLRGLPKGVRSSQCLDQRAELSRNARSRASMRRSKVASMDSGRPKPPAISSEARPWQAARHMRIAWMRSAPSRW
jgi:hypothetical protein